MTCPSCHNPACKLPTLQPGDPGYVDALAKCTTAPPYRIVTKGTRRARTGARGCLK